MGTNYILIKGQEFDAGELAIDETSNTLSLQAVQDDECTILLTDYIEPAELMKVFLEGIKVCSYWMNSKEFKDTLAKLEDYSYD